MKRANDELQVELAADPTARSRYDIENVSADQPHVVQMEVHCGLLEEGGDKSSSADIFIPSQRTANDTADDDDGNSELLIPVIDLHTATNTNNTSSAAVAADERQKPKRRLIEELN